ncbi:enoyl-CoA hydratase-related protein [Phenylobacterium sp.]|uniref:enoyl-CoA hydratase/isomerase family protein n=1 Tax=Phenylobacterium sp. TaxID=1871053 RepID=UPI0025E08AC6|nr:enoyl-CoA hydratase-related protein [Phenylobacterium sp.]
MNDLVRLEREGGVARVTLARPEAGNAVNLELAQQLQEVANACASDPGIRSVLLSAEGKAFCVGGDLSAFAAVQGDARTALLQTMADTFHAAQLQFLTMPKPVVVSVQGAVAGAGLGLALIGDLVVAGSGAHFTSAYTAVGLSADGGSTFLLPRLIGMRRAQQLLLTDRRLTAVEALDWGLVTEIVEPGALDDHAARRARAFANGPTAAYGAIRRLLLTSLASDFASQTDEEGRQIARLAAGPDASEGFAAFLAKRPAIFSGADA